MLGFYTAIVAVYLGIAGASPRPKTAPAETAGSDTAEQGAAEQGAAEQRGADA